MSAKAVTASSKPKGVRRRRLLGALAILAVAVGVGIAWLQLRGGKTVDRPLIALLPAETAVAVQIHQLEKLLEAYDRSPLARLIATDVQIGALLLSEEDLRKWREAHAEAELETHLNLGRDFLLRWAGREVTLALIPAASEPHPGLVVITQAELGFVDRLAELIAQLYPGAELETTEHLGTQITTWVGGAPRDSLSFCRFGETVALSLRTDSTAYLEAIIDAAKAVNPPEQPVFPPPGVPGVHGWANASRLPGFLASLPSDRVSAWLASPEGQETMDLVGQAEEARLAYTLDQPRALSLTVDMRPGVLTAPEIDEGWRSLARRDALCVFHLENPAIWWRHLGHLLIDNTIEVDPDWDTERHARHVAKREWRVRLHDWLERDGLPLLDGPATLVIDSVTPRLGVPTVQAALVWETSQPDALRNLIAVVSEVPEATIFRGVDPEHVPDWAGRADRQELFMGEMRPVWQTDVGELGLTVQENLLIVTLDLPGAPFTRALLTGWPDSISQQRGHRSVAAQWGDAPRVGELYVHGFPLTQLSPMLLLLSPDIFGETGQRRLHQISLANSLLTLYPAAGIAVQQEADRLHLTLSVAASGEERVRE